MENKHLTQHVANSKKEIQTTIFNLLIIVFNALEALKMPSKCCVSFTFTGSALLHGRYYFTFWVAPKDNFNPKIWPGWLVNFSFMKYGALQGIIWVSWIYRDSPRLFCLQGFNKDIALFHKQNIFARLGTKTLTLNCEFT